MKSRIQNIAVLDYPAAFQSQLEDFFAAAGNGYDLILSSRPVGTLREMEVFVEAEDLDLTRFRFIVEEGISGLDLDSLDQVSVVFSTRVIYTSDTFD